MMKTQLKWILTTHLFLGAVLIVTLPASAAVRFQGGFGVGPVIRPWGWYAPYYGPYGPYGFYGPHVYSRAGEVKLDTKDAEVFPRRQESQTYGKVRTTVAGYSASRQRPHVCAKESVAQGTHVVMQAGHWDIGCQPVNRKCPPHAVVPPDHRRGCKQHCRVA